MALNPYLVVLFGVLGVSSASIMIRLVEAPPIIISLYRLGITFVLLTPSTLLKYRDELKALTKKDLMTAALSGIFLALHFYTWISSLWYTTVSSSTVLVNTHSIFVLVGSYILFRERVSNRALFGTFLALAGGIFISISDFRLNSEAFLGDILALAGAFFIAGYFLIGRGLRQRMSLTPYTFVVYGSCTLVLLMIALGTSTPLSPGPPMNIALYLALAIVPTLLGHSIFNWALKYVQATVVSIAMLGEPVGATILAILVLRELPTLVQAVGGAVIIAGLYIFITATEKKEVK
ncbi:MAG: DMT family transporter [Bacillota bacterium]|nr:DMT family transporter [Bacillota bacterium]